MTGPMDADHGDDPTDHLDANDANHQNDEGNAMNDETISPDPSDSGFDSDSDSDSDDDALEAALRGGLGTRAALAAPSAEAWDRIDERRATPSAGRGRALGLSMLTAAAAVILILGVVFMSRSDDTDLHVGGPSESSTTVSTAAAVSGTSTTQATSGTTPAPTETTTPAPAPLPVDLANATFPTEVCPSDARPPGPEFTLVDGKWGANTADEGPFDPAKPLGVELRGAPVAALDGAGVDTFAIWMLCFRSHSDGATSTIAVVNVHDATGKATVLATRFESGTRPMGSFTRVPDDESAPITEQKPLHEQAAALRIENGLIVVEWSQGIMGYQEDEVTNRMATVTYRLSGDTLVIVGQPVATSTPLPAGSLLPEQLYAIRTVDLRSVTLPLAMGERDPSQFVCHDFFGAPPEEVVDARLVNGEANVLDTTGSPLIDHNTGLPRNATVKIEQVFYGDFTGAGPEEAMVVIRCGTDVEAYRVPVVFHLVNGQPQVLEVISNPPGSKSALEVINDRSSLESRLKIVWGWDPTFHPGQPGIVVNYLHWDGTRFLVAASS